jgi:myo-inositol-1(or 4)-monophosphatase
MNHSAAEDMQLLQDTARLSGRIAMGFFGKDPETWNKQGGSPVTEADMAVDDYLRHTLLEARPDYGWLSEETADTVERLDKQRIFIVDPIDGTRGFIRGDARWCVSVAVVEDGRPIAAALMVPVQQRMMTASLGGGAFCDGVRLAASQTPYGEEALVAGPQSWLDGKSFAHVRTRGADHAPSLAYRFAQVALGETDAAFSKPRSHDWDLAACDLLVHEAGGRLTDLQDRVPRYNRSDLQHDILVAGNAIVQPTLVGELAKGEAGEGAGDRA